MLEIPKNELSKNAMGGTELLLYKLYSSLPEDLLKEFQIIPTRLSGELDETKIRIAWIHDLVGDGNVDYLKNGGWKKFHLLVFVSNWQMQSFINAYNIPWSRCLVIENSIYPIDNIDFDKPKDKIKLIYTPTPHRGLSILINAFPYLLQEFPNLELDVFSSFNLYGWGERDKEYQKLFDICRDNPNINYHGTQSNETVRKALTEAHIFAYPSIWQETSCLCLIEAMSAGLVCVHSNLGALYETSANWTFQYHYNENVELHTMAFMQAMKAAINNFNQDKMVKNRLLNQKNYVDQIHNWNYKKIQWEGLLKQLVSLPRGFPKEDLVINYRT